MSPTPISPKPSAELLAAEACDALAEAATAVMVALIRIGSSRAEAHAEEAANAATIAEDWARELRRMVNSA